MITRAQQRNSSRLSVNACFEDQKTTVLKVDQTTLKMGTRVSGIRSLLSIERKGLTIGCQIWKCRSYWLRMSLVSVQVKKHYMRKIMIPHATQNHVKQVFNYPIKFITNGY